MTSQQAVAASAVSHKADGEKSGHNIYFGRIAFTLVAESKSLTVASNGEHVWTCAGAGVKFEIAIINSSGAALARGASESSLFLAKQRVGFLARTCWTRRRATCTTTRCASGSPSNSRPRRTAHHATFYNLPLCSQISASSSCDTR